MSISCGHCHGSHDTLGEVFLCSGNHDGGTESREDAQARADKLDPGIYVLPDGRKYKVQRAQKSGHNYAKRYDAGSKHFEYAPGEITEILPEHAVTAAPDPVEGVYQDPEGHVFSVKVAVHGSGKLVARQLVIPEEDDEDSPKPYWVYLGLAREHITPLHHLMTIEQAEAFGRLYGVCCRCGIVLTNPESIERGIGPVCAGKW